MRVSEPPREPRISGVLLLDQIQVMIDELGQDTYAKALVSLPEETRQSLDSLIPVSWIDVAMAKALKDAVAREVGKESLEFQRWIVHAATGKTINKFWRMLLTRIWDGALVRRAPILYGRAFDRGSFKLSELGEGTADFVLSGWSTMPEYDAVGLASGTEAVLEYSGRQGVRVRFERKNALITFHASWRKA